MNRGFITYFNGGVKAASRTVYKNKGFLSYWLYTLMAFFGHLTLIFSAAFDLANVRQAKLAHADNHAAVAENFRVACKAKSLWAYIGARVLEFFILLAGIVLIGIATGMLALIGLLISYAAPDFPQEYIILIFCIPGALAELTLLIMTPILFAPTAYIVESNPGISAAATVSACIKTMRRSGKWTCFMNVFIPALILAVIVGIFVGAAALVNLFLGGIESVMITIAIAFVFIPVFFTVFPIFHLTAKIAEKSLFDDISLDPINAGKHASGVNIRRCRGVLFSNETVEENLSALFDETDNEDAPLPASGARTKRNKSARAGMKKADLSDGDDNNDTSDRQGRK